MVGLVEDVAVIGTDIRSIAELLIGHCGYVFAHSIPLFANADLRANHQAPKIVVFQVLHRDGGLPCPGCRDNHSFMRCGKHDLQVGVWLDIVV